MQFTLRISAVLRLSLIPVLTAALILTAAPANAQSTGAESGSPDSLTVLVTKNIGIGNYQPTDLMTLGELGAGSERLRQVVYNDLRSLMQDMAAASVPVKITSAYRSFDQQNRLYLDGITQNPNNVSIIAKPGFSEHQTGLALDFGAVLNGPNPGFANTEQSRWLQANAYRYGFALSYPAGGESVTGYSYEPWHWRYIGKTAAKDWKDSGQILQIFLAGLPQNFNVNSLMGRVVKIAADPTVYTINSNATKRAFVNAEAFLSYGHQWNDILILSQEQLDTIPKTDLVKLSADPTVYRLNPDYSKQAVTSPEAFEAAGFTWTDIVEVNATELNAYRNGTYIN